MRGRAPALGNFCGITGALGCSCIGSPPLESSRQGFYGSGELRSGLLAGMIAFRFRWLLLPASYLSQEGEISPQLGAGVLAARGSGEEQGPPARGGGFPDLGKGSSAPTSRQGQWVTDCPSKPQICSFLPLLCSTEGGHPPAVAEAELGAAGVLCAPLRGEVLHFVLCPFWLPLPPPGPGRAHSPGAACSMPQGRCTQASLEVLHLYMGF